MTYLASMVAVRHFSTPFVIEIIKDVRCGGQRMLLAKLEASQSVVLMR